MADLHRRFPNDREQSLFASVELSLRKLPPDLRAKLPPLGVFHGGGNVVTIAQVLGLDLEQGEHEALARALIDVGLAEIAGIQLPPVRPGAGAVPPPRAGRPGASGRRGPLGGGNSSAHERFSIDSRILTPSSPPRSRFRSCPTSWRRSSGARDPRRAARSAWSR